MNKRPAMKRKLPAYEKGGLVTKPKPAPTPTDIDHLSALPPEKRRAYEKKAEQQTLRDYPPAKKAAPAYPPGVGKPPLVSPRVPSGARYTGEVTKGGKDYQSFRDSTGREILVPAKK